MIITVVCDVLGEENNGTTIAAMNFIRYLKEKGHTVRLLCCDKDKDGLENVYVVPNMSFGKLLNAYVKKIGVTIAKPQEDVIRAAVTGADIVHSILPFGLGMKAASIANEMKIPITGSFHMQAENLTSYIKLNKFGSLNRTVYKFIYKHFYCKLDAVHYPTEFIRRTFEKNIKTSTNGYVISNGVHSYVEKRSVSRPSELEDKIIILTTGRYAREKSQDTLIKAVKYSKYKDKIQLILGGQGVKEKKYKHMAKALPVSPVFKFYSRTEIIDVLNYSDIYVHSAECELEGISCLEAIVCGKLTIVSSSKKSATREFAIDGKCVFKNRDPRSLAKVIDYWIDHPEEKVKYEKLYLEKAGGYSLEQCMERMEDMLYDVMKKYGKEKDLLHR